MVAAKDSVVVIVGLHCSGDRVDEESRERFEADRYGFDVLTLSISVLLIFCYCCVGDGFQSSCWFQILPTVLRHFRFDIVRRRMALTWFELPFCRFAVMGIVGNYFGPKLKTTKT